MSMMMTIIKDRKSMIASCSLLLLVLIGLFFYRSGEMGSPDRRQLELQTFQLEDGWGYKIRMNRKVLIYQPTIPSIDTMMSFPNETSAKAAGSLVLERLNRNQDFSITKDDIKYLFKQKE
ncbi:DUF4907 domain-containing protein [Bacteroides sp. AM07-16]|nr:DUF4907 domain-containing protein [Bacteroides sp. AM07-16]